MWLDGTGELTTDRLSMRRPVRADIGAILAIHADPEACRHNPGDMITTRAGAEVLFGRWADHWDRNGFGYWVLRRVGADEVLGFCGVKTMRLHDATVANLFYRLGPSAWGAGIGTEAASAAVGWAVGNLTDQPVIARVRPDNVASHRVADKAGLVRAPHLDTPGEDGLDHLYIHPSQPALRHPRRP